MRSILAKVYFSIIQSQAWVALCFTLLCLYFQKINHIYNPQLLWIAFFATIFAYNLAYWYAYKRDVWRIPLMVLSIMACLFFAFQGLHLWSWLLLIFLGGISILYTIPIQSIKLRELPNFKIFWIAMVWSLTMLLPWLENDHIAWWPMLWQTLCVFCFVLGITLPFDIRDMQLDLIQLKTIPQLIGIERSIRLSTQLLFLSGSFLLISVHFATNATSLSFLITILFSIGITRRTCSSNSIWFVPFWIEGLSALPYVIYIFLR